MGGIYKVGIAFLFTENCLRCDLSYTETWKLFAERVKLAKVAYNHWRASPHCY